MNNLYEMLSENMDMIMKDDDIKNMLNPDNNAITRKFLVNNEINDAYVKSLMFIIMLEMKIKKIDN